MFNFEEIKRKIIEANAGFEVKDFKELAKKIELILHNKDLKFQTVSNFKKLCKLESAKAKKF